VKKKLFTPEEPIVKKVSLCSECGLYKQCASPKFNYVGLGEKGIMFVASIPSKEEDESGCLGMGTHFSFLRDAVADIGFDLLRDCYYTTAVNCRPAGGKAPVVAAVNACRQRLQSLIQRLNPKMIVLLGGVPNKALIYPRLRGRLNGTAWTDFVGEIIPDQDLGRYISAISDPGYLLSRKVYPDGGVSKPLFEREPPVLGSWMETLERIFTHSTTFYKSSYIGDCLYSTNIDEVLIWLEKALSWEYMAFDYETNGLKPHREGHKIVCASISDGLYSYAFPVFDDPKFRKAWKRLMLSDVKKIGHNLMFENMWTHTILGYFIENWYWDCMITAHILENHKPTNLKYQTYVRFGDIGYDSEIDHFLSASEKEEEMYGANAINRIDEAPLDKLLLYNALDSLYTFKLWEYQKRQITEFQTVGNEFFLESAVVLSKTQENGFAVDIDIWKNKKVTLTEEMNRLSDQILATDEAKLWDKEEVFNFNSTQQLSHMLFDILKLEPKAYTKGKKPCVDKENLPLYDTPMIKLILAYRRLGKMMAYLDNCIRESVDGIMHPSTNIHTVDTMRSSANNVNYQNIFKKDEEAKTFIREGFVPRKGNRIIEYDHGQLEVRINACYSGDKNLIRYIEQGLDMHTDSTMDCFMLGQDEVKKQYRNAVKGMFVFAEFYGSYYAQVAKDLWDFAQGEEELRLHLIEKGVKKYSQFEHRIEEAERILWEERFPEHAEWRKDMFKFYNKHGYIETFTGFRLLGPMNKNNTFNGQVQGSAYHVLQWAMNKVATKMETRCERSYVIGEIHDALVTDVHPSEEAWVDEWVRLYGTVKVKEKWPWIIVPLVMEKEASDIDGSWAHMNKCGHLGE
jgi:uracil-DNA glycosylase family 4